MAKIIEHIATAPLINRFGALYMLLKPRLSYLVVFSSGFGYCLATHSSIDIYKLAGFLLGGFLISGSACAMNQIIERDLDKCMKRTVNRPIPSGALSKQEALYFGAFTGIVGLILMVLFSNPMTVILCIISFILYVFVYTPLKRVGSVSVFFGALPGALPPLIGWTAITASISYEAIIIFSIQFIWQFPHFWAIAWVMDEDYKKAGFKLLPGSGEKDFNTAVNIMIYALFLIPLGLMPAFFGITGLTSGVVATLCGILFLAQTFSLMKTEFVNNGAIKKETNIDTKAKRIMFGSFIYLPLVQISYLLDKT